jgi:hypothetical protein
MLAKHVDLDDPMAVKRFIAVQQGWLVKSHKWATK